MKIPVLTGSVISGSLRPKDAPTVLLDPFQEPAV